MEKPESIKLYFSEGKSDKEYNAYLEQEAMGWKVRFSYGRRGNAGNSGTKTPFPIEYEKAKKIYDKLVYSKIAKGYTKDKKGVPFLSAAEDKKPTGWAPQLLNPITDEEIQKYIDSDGWCAQEKFDGRNRLLIKQGELITGTNRKGLAVPISEEMMKELKSLPDCVLAGEDMGDFIACFDIISEKTGYMQRLKKLYPLIVNLKVIKMVYTAYERKDKIRLLKKLRKQNAEGIVFKQLDAFYTPSRPESGGSQLKFKFVQSASIIVGDTNKGKRSVEMWVLDGDLRVNVGSVTIYPNQPIPKKGEILEVQYLYAYKEGSLFQPINLGIRNDLDDKACTIKQLKYKRED